MSEARFDPNIHTREAFTDQVGEIAAGYPDVIFVGSVGRAALVGVELAPHKRRVSPEARDIDTAFTDPRRAPSEIEEHAYPFPVDHAFYGQIVIPEGGEWATVFCDPRYPEVHSELPAEVFEPYPARYNGVSINTFHPDTMLHLHEISNSKRPKDRRNLREFEQRLDRERHLRIPDHYFESLQEMHDEIKDHPELCLYQRVERAQELYKHAVPLAVRERLTPALKAFKQNLGLRSRREGDPVHKQEA